MSHVDPSRRAHPLTNLQRAATAHILRLLADELESPAAARTQQNLGVAAQTCFPSTAGGGQGGGSGPSSPVEAMADAYEPEVGAAVMLMLRQRRLVHDAEAVLTGLRGWRPYRPTALWACGHVLDPTYKRCQSLDDDGRQCGCATRAGDGPAAPPEERYCQNPTCDRTEPLKVGEKRWKAVALDLGTEVQECDRCRKHRKTWGTSWGVVTTGRLALGTKGLLSMTVPAMTS